MTLDELFSVSETWFPYQKNMNNYIVEISSN